MHFAPRFFLLLAGGLAGCNGSAPFFLLLAGGLAGCNGSAPSSPPAGTAQLTAHTEVYRDCALRRRVVAPLDSCASIRVKWFTVEGKPGITTHLYQHVLTWADASAPGLRVPPQMRAALRHVLLADSGFAEKRFSVEVVQNGGGRLTLQNRWYYDGNGAHPSEGLQFYNYDLAGDQLLTLDALLNPGYQPQLLAMAKEALYKQNPGKSMLDAPAHFYLTNNFLITSQGLRFHYNAGQVGATAGGPVELELTWQQLQPLLRPDGPLQMYAPEPLRRS